MSRSRRGPIGWGMVLLAAPLCLLPATPSGASPAKEAEAWDAIYAGGKKVGHIHIQVEPLSDRGQELLRVRVGWFMTMKRGGDAVHVEQQYGTIETPDGQVLKLESRVFGGKDSMVRTYGEARGNEMHLAMSVNNRETREVIPWGPDIRGPYGAELSLSRQPIKPGEARDVRTYLPEMNKVCTTHLKAVDLEEVELGGRVKRSLLRVESGVRLPDGKPYPGADATLWVDSGGQILKTYVKAFDLYTYRTTREAAQATSGGKFDVLATSIVRIKHKIANPDATRDVIYRVTLRDGDPAEVFPNDRRQTVRRLNDPQVAQLEVRSAGPDDGPPGPEAVGAEFLRPNPIVDSADAEVVKLAREAVGGRTDPWQKAVAIQHWVHEKIRDKNFETAFAPASEVARSLAGDCTEHSVLTMAMCRAAGVPARAAIGMIYADSLGGFGFHMWTEVFVNRRWVAIDSAFDQGTVDAVHIKLSDSSLDGISPYETFLSVVNVFGKLKVEPLEIR